MPTYRIALIATGIFILHMASASAEIFNERFCKKEYPKDPTACTRYIEQQDHKLFTGGGSQQSQQYSNDTLYYDPQREQEKLRTRKPVKGSIIMDSGPAKEIPMQ
jgi:hypothetical protein